MKALALALALVASTPAAARQDARAHRQRLRYVVSGAVLLGFFYTLSAALAIRFEEPELSVPVLGPLIDLRRCSGCTASPVEQGIVAGMVLDSLLQATGATLLLVGARY
ncbi:MAG TPA: hypothetical protein VF334_20360 [Polyangia bacterium]